MIRRRCCSLKAATITILLVFIAIFSFFYVTHFTSFHMDQISAVLNLSADHGEPSDSVKYTSPWTWTCGDDQTCHRELRKSNDYMSMDNCSLTCGQDRVLWPKSRNTLGLDNFGPETFDFDVENMELTDVEENNDKVKDLAEKAFSIMKENVKKLYPMDFVKNYDYGGHCNSGTVEVSIKIECDDHVITLITDESYTLKINRDGNRFLLVQLIGKTFFGIRHGLETLSQLIIFDDEVNTLKTLSPVLINDSPAFPYRGLMIDSARNFIPIGSLERMIDGMSYNKLNMLHWHLSDSNSFPFFSRTYPQMTHYGAYSKKEIYTPNQVRNLVEYALVRGIKIIPELDAPAHAGNGWQWGPETEGYGNLAFCVNEEPWKKFCGQPPCGQLNPANPKVYEVLGGIYSDMLSVFDPDLFHMGGDEVWFECWKNQSVQTFMKENNLNDFMDLRVYFQNNAYEKLKMAATKPSVEPNDKVKSNTAPVPIIWTSDLTDALTKLKKTGEIEPNRYIIQAWLDVPARNPKMRKLLDAGYPMIASYEGTFYLDHGAGSWIGDTDGPSYHSWQTLYDFDFQANGYDINKRVKNFRFGEIPQILGGEATLWTEKVNEMTMDGKLWPRGAAFAERLWTNPKVTSSSPTNFARLLRQNERMKLRGIHVETRQPKSCILIGSVCEILEEKTAPSHTTYTNDTTHA